MATPPSTRAQPLLRWRLAGTWLVLFAIGLATVAITLALLQASHISTQLIVAAEPRAERIAAGVDAVFERRTERALSAVAESIASPEDGSRWTAPSNWPVWLDGLYAWNGVDLTSIRNVPSASDDVRAATARILQARLALRPIFDPTKLAPAGIDLIVDQLGDSKLVFATLHGKSVRGSAVTVVAHVNTMALREKLLDPVIAENPGFAVVPTGLESTTWERPLGRALKGWAIQPTEAFRRAQGRALLAQTGAYVGLTLLSLGILIVSLWILTRLARREAALAAMKTSFVAGVSHELKTPLAMIQMFVETLESGRVASDEKKQEYLRVIARESDRLVVMIDNLLDFSRIEAGKQEYQFESVNLAEVASETYEAYRLQLDHKGFEHFLNIAEGIPNIRADRHAVAQALINLIGNAVKYSEDEKFLAIEIVADARRDQQGALISVHDHGIGIAPEDRRRLFEGFYRAEDHRVRQRGGTGLGLAVLKHFVDAHNGTLEVESRLVKGTTFRIFLPEGVPEGAPGAVDHDDPDERDQTTKG